LPPSCTAVRRFVVVVLVWLGCCALNSQTNTAHKHVCTMKCSRRQVRGKAHALPVLKFENQSLASSSGLVVLPQFFVYLLAGLMAQNLLRELQMSASAPTRHTTEKRTPLWVFTQLDTLRAAFIQRAGRLTRPHGKLTLTISASLLPRQLRGPGRNPGGLRLVRLPDPVQLPVRGRSGRHRWPEARGRQGAIQMSRRIKAP